MSTFAALPEEDCPELSPSASSLSLSSDAEFLSSSSDSHEHATVGLGLDIALEQLSQAGAAYYSSQKSYYPHQASSLYAQQPDFGGNHYGSYIADWQQDVSSSLWSDPDTQYRRTSAPSYSHASPSSQLAWQLDHATGFASSTGSSIVKPVQEDSDDDDELSEEEVALLRRTSHQLRTEKRASQDATLAEEARLSAARYLQQLEDEQAEKEAGFVEWRRQPVNQLPLLRKEWRASSLELGIAQVADSIHDRVVSGEVSYFLT